MDRKTHARRAAMSSWQEVHDETVESFGGQTPGRELEGELAKAFGERPAAIRALLANVASGYASGRVHSPWALVRRELERDAKRAELVADESPERERATHLAERYIANAGLYLPTEAELLDALFRPHGPLKAFAGDDGLRQRMLAAWQAERPRGLEAEREQFERAQRWRDGQAALRSSVPPIEWPVRQHAYADSGSAMRPLVSVRCQLHTLMF